MHSKKSSGFFSIKTLRSYRPWVQPREIIFTLGALIFILFSVYAVYIGISYVDIVNPYPYLPRDQKFTLPDPLLDTLSVSFKNSSLPPNVSDTLVQVSLALIIIRILISGRKTLIMARRVAYLVGFLYLLRIPFMIMTLLPNPLLECVPHRNPNIFIDALLLVGQQRASCGDLMYSGHTVAFMSGTLVWSEFPLIKKFHPVIYIVSVLYGFLSVLSLVASSYHYTLDVVISAMVSLFSWRMYKFIVSSDFFIDTFYGRFLLFIDQEYYMTKPNSNSSSLTFGEQFV